MRKLLPLFVTLALATCSAAAADGNSEAVGLVISEPGTYDGRGAEVSYLYVRSSDVVAENYRVTGAGPGVACVNFEGDRITIRRIDVTHCGATGVQFFSGTANVLEDSTVHDPVTRPGQDSWSIYQSENAGDVTVRRVIAHGSGFGVYAPRGSALVEDSEFSVPDDLRTDCKGNRVPGGPCQCAEFGIGLKTGRVTIRGNRISGYRKSDPMCGGSGTPGAGIDPSACGPDEICPTSSVVIERNVIVDNHVGVYIGPQSRGIAIRDNGFCGNEIAISDGFSDAGSTIERNLFHDNDVGYSRYGAARARYSSHDPPPAAVCR